MLPFIILLLVPIMIQHVSIAGHTVDYKKRNVKAIKLFFILLTILVMFRHESIGNDTRNYIYIFKKISSLSWNELGKDSLEIGFSFYNKIVSLITEEPQMFLVFTALIISSMIYPTYKRLCTDASLTITIFCIMSTFVMMFSGIRQMLAIGVGFLAYECTRNRKLFLFILCVILAMMFHISAFMLAFMYPMYHARITKKWLIVIVPVLAFVFLFNKQIFSILGLLLASFTKYDASITQTGAFTMLLLFAAFAIFAFLIPDESVLDSETIGLRNFLLLSVVLQMFAPLHTIAMRMNYYYIIFIPLLIPKVIEAKSIRWRQIAIAGRHVMVVFFLVYFFYNAYISKSNLNVFPYRFFWEGI